MPQVCFFSLYILNLSFQTRFHLYCFIQTGLEILQGALKLVILCDNFLLFLEDALYSVEQVLDYFAFTWFKRIEKALNLFLQIQDFCD